MASPRALSIVMMLMLYLASQVVATPAQSSSVESATLTTLPPADPTTNNADPCAFSNRTSLLNRIDNDLEGYNISLLVATCNSVCAIVYGSGNPDISGIGAMTSYYIQGVITLILGPMVAFLLVVYGGRTPADLPSADIPNADLPDIDLPKANPSSAGPSDADSSKTESSLPTWLSAVIPLAQYHYQANHIIALSVLIASAARLSQAVPLAEISLIDSLSMYQLLNILICSITEPFLFEDYGGATSFIYPLATASLYRLAIFTLGGFVVPNMSSWASKSPALQQISKLCTSELDYPYSPPSTDSSLPGGLATEISIALLIGIAGVVFIFIFVRFYVRHRLFNLISSAVGVAIAFGGGVFLLVKLQRIRHQLQIAAGDAYQDSEWGFGQIMALLVWYPTIEEFIRALPKMLASKEHV